MRPEILFFQIGAAAALLLLFRHEWKNAGRTNAVALFLFLTLLHALRETISGMGPKAYAPDTAIAAIGRVNVVVLAGWLFSSYAAFQLALLLQRRRFPAATVFLTLALTALVTTAISFPVEITGTALRLWVWHGPIALPWLPFDYPTAAFKGWSNKTVTAMLIYCTYRYRLFSPVRWRGLAIVIAVLLAKDLPFSFGISHSPREAIHAVYITTLAVLGFYAPVRWCGTASGEPALAERPPERWTAAGEPSGKELLREHWEIFAALGIMSAVLAVLEIVSLNAAIHLLSLAPLAFLVLAVFVPLTWRLALAWTLPFFALSAVTGEWRYLGLAYPVVPLGLVALVYRRNFFKTV